MRVGMSSGGRWHVSMGLLGWVLIGWIVLPVVAVWYLVLGIIWACQVIDAWRHARKA